MKQRFTLSLCLLLALSGAVQAADNRVEHLTVRGKSEVKKDSELLALVVKLDAANSAGDRAGLEEQAKALAALAAKQESAIRRHFEGLANYLIASQAEGPKNPQGLAALDRAIAALERALELAPKFSESMSYLGSSYGSRIGAGDNPMLDGMKYGPQADRAMKTASAADPDNPIVRLNQGINLLFTPEAWGGSAEGAMAEFKKARELDPGYVDAKVWTAVGMFRVEKQKEGAALFAKIKREHPEDKRVEGFEMVAKFLPEMVD